MITINYNFYLQFVIFYKSTASGLRRLLSPQASMASISAKSLERLSQLAEAWENSGVKNVNAVEELP